ncbi:MAG: PH domain-containing protein [Micromonosporaceae bacterium]
MQQDQLIFSYPRRRHWLIALGVFIFGIPAGLFFLLPGSFNAEQIWLGVLFSSFALTNVFYLFDSLTAFTVLDATGIQTRRNVFARRAWGWAQVRAIDTHTADVLGLHNLFMGRTTFVRATLIDGKEVILADRDMLNGNGMEATTQTIIAYWHRQYPAASGAVFAG